MIDAATVIARLREVDARSGGRRVAWSDVWADERGRLGPEDLDGLDGARAVVEAHGFDPRALGTPSPRLADVVAAVELHVEQGPALERDGRAVAAVSGCLGVRRLAVAMIGAAGHAGATPMSDRRDPVRAAAAAIVAVADVAEASGGLATVGVLAAEPAIATAIPERCRFTLDLRHADAGALNDVVSDVMAALEDAARAGRCAVEREELWGIEPIRFDPGLAARAATAAGGGDALVSGPLHDSASLAQAGIPAAMLFAPSIGGVSHTRAEDTDEADLVAALDAFGALAADLVEVAS